MDLVHSVRVGRRRVLLYVLAEHQSKVDPWMAFRLLCYLIAIWRGYRAQHPRAKKLPAILPIVVHHSATGWTAPVAFEDLLDADAALLDALGPHVPRFRFLLDDLSAQTDADLRARTQMTAGGRVAILSLKHGRDQVAVRIRGLSPDGRALAEEARSASRRHRACMPESERAFRALARAQDGVRVGSPPTRSLERRAQNPRADPAQLMELPGRW